MAIPSGSGTEVLKRAIIDGQGAVEGTLITGVANHIYTILSIIICERSNTTKNINLTIDPSAGGTDIRITRSLAIGPYETFVWNDRFVLTGTDKLQCITDSGGDFDIICSYIDQDWS